MWTNWNAIDYSQPSIKINLFIQFCRQIIIIIATNNSHHFISIIKKDVRSETKRRSSHQSIFFSVNSDKDSIQLYQVADSVHLKSIWDSEKNQKKKNFWKTQIISFRLYMHKPRLSLHRIIMNSKLWIFYRFLLLQQVVKSSSDKISTKRKYLFK